MTDLDKYIDALKQLAIQFRINDEYSALNSIQDVLGQITANPDIVTKCDLGVLSNINTAMYDCQKREDWLGLADYLEYDLVRAISSSNSD